MKEYLKEVEYYVDPDFSGSEYDPRACFCGEDNELYISE
jgi:hypothetical protein